MTKSQIYTVGRNLSKGPSKMRKLRPQERKWLAWDYIVSQAFISVLSTSHQRLYTECNPGEIAWVGGGQPIKARESKRISYSIYLQKSKASYNNNSLRISSCFHLRISGSLWNSHPTIWGIIICSQSGKLRVWVFYGLLWADSKLSGTTYPLHSFMFLYVLILTNIKTSLIKLTAMVTSLVCSLLGTLRTHSGLCQFLGQCVEKWHWAFGVSNEVVPPSWAHPTERLIMGHLQSTAALRVGRFFFLQFTVLAPHSLSICGRQINLVGIFTCPHNYAVYLYPSIT